MTYITGEKIQNLCDTYIGTVNDFKFNPYIYNQFVQSPDKFITLPYDNINKIDNKYKIFCYTHLFDYITDLLNLFTKFTNPFILVAHNSDNCLSEQHLVLFNKIPNLKHIYVQNTNIINDIITPIPIGIANSQWIHGNLNELHKTITNNNPKTNLVYFNFNILTNKLKRMECYTSIINKLPFIKTIDQPSYIHSLSTHKFAICPEGNGIDCHRLWECIYMKVIPICKKNNLFTYYSTKFPILLLDEWADLDLTSLDNYYASIDWNTINFPTIEYYNNLFNKTT